MAKLPIVAVVSACSLLVAVLSRGVHQLKNDVGVVRQCSNEPLWSVTYRRAETMLTPYTGSMSASAWYDYRAADMETKKKWLLKDGKARVLVYHDTSSGMASIMFFNKPNADSGASVRVRVKYLPVDYEVSALDDPSDIHQVTNSGTGALLTWTMDPAEGDGAAVTFGVTESCIEIKIEANSGVEKMSFVSKGAGATLTRKMLVKTKARLCPVPACGTPTPTPSAAATPIPMAPADQQLWVDSHNVYRSEVSVPNTTWEDLIEAVAQEYADELAANNNCDLVHSSQEFRSTTKFGYLGENLYSRTVYSTNPNFVADWSSAPEDASVAWGEELEDYRFGPTSAACTLKTGNQVGHYTAMVWRTSELLGCGIGYCSFVDGQWYAQKIVAVCHYGAPEDCSEGGMCLNNLRNGYPFCAANRPLLNDGTRMPMCPDTLPTAGCT